MTTGWEELVGGDLEFEPDWEKMLTRSLELIDGKRAALKLPVYDPSQFGASGDTLYFEAVKAQLAGGGNGTNGEGAHTHQHTGAAATTAHLDATEA
jgi:hypothetical protein